MRLIILMFFGALLQELDPYESLSKKKKKKILAGRAKFLVNSKQKGRCLCVCLGTCLAFPLLRCLCRAGHRCTAQLLYLLGWSSALGLVFIFTSE